MSKRKSKHNFISSANTGANFVANPQATVTQVQFGQLGFPGTMDSWGFGTSTDNMPSPDLDINNINKNSRTTPVYPHWVLTMRYWMTSPPYKRIIELPVNDAIKDITLKAEEGLDDIQNSLLMYTIRQKSLFKEFKRTLYNARNFGGAVLLFLNDDANKSATPLTSKEEGVFLCVADCWQINRTGRFETVKVKQETFAIPERNYFNGEVFSYLGHAVHPSRAVVVKNPTPPNFWSNITNGWGYSLYDATGATLSAYDRYWDSIFSLLAKTNIDVLTIKDLRTIVANPQAYAEIKQQLLFSKQTQKSFGTLIAQEGDTLERKQINMGDLFAGADKVADNVCMCAGIPKRYLFGEDPKGLNNGGESSIEIYASHIAGLREDYAPALTKAIEKFAFAFLGMQFSQLEVEFGVMRRPSFAEELAKQQFQTTLAKEHLDAGIITQEQFVDTMNRLNVLPIQYEVQKLIEEPIDDVVDAEKTEDPKKDNRRGNILSRLFRAD